MKAKKPTTRKRKNGGTNWKTRCANLRHECDQLRQQLLTVQDERDRYLKAVYALSFEPVDIDKKALFAHLGQKPPLDEFIAKLKSSYGK
jgi:hypothetical protein